METTAQAPRRVVPRVLFAVVAPLQAFFRTQAASGVVLLLATATALVWANSSGSHVYHELLEMPVEVRIAQWGLAWPLHHWINDALMAVFFLVAGMEIKHATTVGELRSLRQATLPLLAAVGGMVVPALLFLVWNRQGEGRQGWGIPMATDIAFAVGCLSLIRSRIPSGLFIFLTALAIFDDLGAIIVIAVFYGGTIHLPALGLAGALTLALVLLSRLRVQRLAPYLLLGVALWGATLASGIHATLAGVVLGLTLPARSAREPDHVLEALDRAIDSLRRACTNPSLEHASLLAMEKHLEAMQSPLSRLLHVIEKPVAFGIVPLFAVANAGVTLGRNSLSLLLSPVSLGVLVGLFVGKTVGVFGATFVAVSLRFADRPARARWVDVLGVSMMAGVGFTMSLFITMLAFDGAPLLVAEAKVGILAGSFLAASAGLLLLRSSGKVIPAQEAGSPCSWTCPASRRGTRSGRGLPGASSWGKPWRRPTCGGGIR